MNGSPRKVVLWVVLVRLTGRWFRGRLRNLLGTAYGRDLETLQQHKMIRNVKTGRHVSKSTYVLADSSAPRSTSLNRRVRSQSFLRKGQPQFTEILAAGQDLVGLDDSITSLKETGTALLQLHAIEDKLHNQGVAVLRHELTRGAR